MKLTRHNGRFGKNGTYNPKHNDRRFDVENSEHIDADRTSRNIYWDCYQGFHYPEQAGQEENISHSFEKIEEVFYWEHYEEFCTAQHERNRKTGHTERNRSPDDLRRDPKTCPEESLIQIGTIEGAVSGETLRMIAVDFFDEFERRFGEHVHILDWSLHLDESTPHIHERHVFDCPNRYGEIAPQQENALKALGIELPHPDKKIGRTNNRKITFDSACRAMLFDIVRKHGLHLDQEPEYGGRAYLEKQDYILQKQREQMTVSKEELAAVQMEMQAEEQQLELIRIEYRERKDELEKVTARLHDAEKFVKEITDTAYEKAVEAVTEKAVEETHNMDFEVLEQFREKVKKNLPFEAGIRRIVYDITAILMEDFLGVTEKITGKLKKLFADSNYIESMKRETMITVRERLRNGPSMKDSIDEPEEELPEIRRSRSR